MKTIKFKAKRLDNKEWTCGYFYEENDNTYIIENRQKESILNRNITHEVDPDTVCQFTGFHDKNGKEIYEGDVLLKVGGVLYDIINTPYEVYGIIGFEDYRARFVINDFYLTINGNKGTGNACGHSFTQDYMQGFEVVGSVHDKEWQEKLKLNNE